MKLNVAVDGKRYSNGHSASPLLFDIRKNGGMKCETRSEYKEDFGGNCTDSSDGDLEEEEEEGNEWRYNPDDVCFKETVRACDD